MAEIVSAPVIRRYAEILQVFLRAEHPVALLHANYRIRQLAKQRQFRIATEGKKPTLTDIIETVLPGAWLRTEYPEMSSRKAGEYCASIDIITVKRTPVPVYALALAALFESADEALKYWFDQTAESPSERKTYRRFGWNFWHSERVFELYVAHRGNHAKIGEILEIDPNNTRLGLSSAGLPALGLVDMNAAGKALRDFDQGTPLDRACERNGAARNEVEKLLRVGCSRLLTALERIEQPEMPRQRSRTLHKTAPAEEVGRASPRSRRRNQNPYRSGVVSLFS